MSPEVAQAVAGLGGGALLVLGIWGFLTGRVRVGTLVDRERDRIIADRDLREAKLIAERDAWRDRSLASDDRLDRLAGSWERLTKTAAPE